MPVTNSFLHAALINFAIEHGYAPSTRELASRLDASESEIADALQVLADDHGVVLHPGTTRPWVVHPFAFAPTNFLLRSGDRQWWGNCAWCGLGAAHLLNRDLEIVTTLGADGKQVVLRVVGGELLDTNFVVHFPVPMRDAWQNVVYTCSVMLLFENETSVDAWCRRHHFARGDVQPVSKIWEFARVWYGNHRSADWKKWTTDQAREIFERFGLKGPIWELPRSGNRF